MSLNLEVIDNFNVDTDESFEDIKTFSAIAHEEDVLQVYLKEIGKIKLLKSDEERNLGKLIKEDKDEIAKRKLIQANLRLVVSIAKRYRARCAFYGFSSGRLYWLNSCS